MEQNQLERSLMKADKNSADIAWQWLSNRYEQIIVTASLRQLETLRLTFGIAILIAFHTCTHDSQHRAVRHNLVDDVQVMNETFSPSFFSLRILVKVSLFWKVVQLHHRRHGTSPNWCAKPFVSRLIRHRYVATFTHRINTVTISEKCKKMCLDGRRWDTERVVTKRRLLFHSRKLRRFSEKMTRRSVSDVGECHI